MSRAEIMTPRDHRHWDRWMRAILKAVAAGEVTVDDAVSEIGFAVATIDGADQEELRSILLGRSQFPPGFPPVETRFAGYLPRLD